MLYILFGLSIVGIIIGIRMIINPQDYGDIGWRCVVGISITVFCSVTTLVMIFAIPLTFSEYYDVKSCIDDKIAIIEERNEEIVNATYPIIEKYIEYEGSTFKELKPTAEKLIAMSAYPTLQSNVLIQEQIKVLKENNTRLTDLKLQKAELKSYWFWLFIN